MSPLTLFALGSLGAWALIRPDAKRTTSGSVELVPGVRYKFTYETPTLIDGAEAIELLEKHSVANITVTAGARGFRLLSFEAVSTTSVKATIGTPLSLDREDVVLVEVRRLD